jgi:hypothetical protein
MKTYAVKIMFQAWDLDGTKLARVESLVKDRLQIALDQLKTEHSDIQASIEFVSNTELVL